MLSARLRSSSSTKTVSVARRRCIIVSLSRDGVSRRWCSVACLPPGGWWGGGVRDWMSVGKKTHVIGTKNVFLFLFAKKKPQKKRAKERYFTTQTSSFQHRTPKCDAPRTKKPPPGRNGNGRRRSKRASSNAPRILSKNPLSTRDDIRRPASSSRAFFL